MARIALVVLALIAMIAVCFGGVGVSSYNELVTLEQGVTAQWAQVENVYQRRADLVPNLVETVKGAAAHERETLEAVTEARSRVSQLNVDASVLEDPEAFQRFQQAQDQLSSALSRLLAVSEAYPQLTATAAFRDLQAQLEGTENRIAVERQRFNEAARAYNTRRNQFPTVLIAPILGFEGHPYFQAQAGAETAPRVEF